MLALNCNVKHADVISPNSVLASYPVPITLYFD